ncbi:hypothetical protein M569_01049, partial [Genlisea aurea]
STMAGLVTLPGEYGYVILVLVFYSFINFWMLLRVGQARRKYKVFYPALYANESENKDAKLFNCIQRGHQNSVEFMPLFFMLMIVGGLKHPLTSASFGVVYCIARIFYFTGYSTGIPEKRATIGKYNYLGLLGLMICSISGAVRMIIA